MTYQEWLAEEQALLKEWSLLQRDYAIRETQLHDRWMQLLDHKPDLILPEK